MIRQIDPNVNALRFPLSQTVISYRPSRLPSIAVCRREETAVHASQVMVVSSKKENKNSRQKKLVIYINVCRKVESNGLEF
jgi:hypothetical protein